MKDMGRLLWRADTWETILTEIEGYCKFAGAIFGMKPNEEGEYLAPSHFLIKRGLTFLYYQNIQIWDNQKHHFGSTESRIAVSAGF